MTFTCDVGSLMPWSDYFCYWQQLELFLCIISPCDSSKPIDSHSYTHVVYEWKRLKSLFSLRWQHSMHNIVTQCNAINARRRFHRYFVSKCTPITLGSCLSTHTNTNAHHFSRSPSVSRDVSLLRYRIILFFFSFQSANIYFCEVMYVRIERLNDWSAQKATQG